MSDGKALLRWPDTGREQEVGPDAVAKLVADGWELVETEPVKPARKRTSRKASADD